MPDILRFHDSRATRRDSHRARNATWLVTYIWTGTVGTYLVRRSVYPIYPHILPKGGFPLSHNFYVRMDVNFNWLYVRKLKIEVMYEKAARKRKSWARFTDLHTQWHSSYFSSTKRSSYDKSSKILETPTSLIASFKQVMMNLSVFQFFFFAQWSCNFSGGSLSKYSTFDL